MKACILPVCLAMVAGATACSSPGPYAAQAAIEPSHYQTVFLSGADVSEAARPNYVRARRVGTKRPKRSHHLAKAVRSATLSGSSAQASETLPDIMTPAEKAEFARDRLRSEICSRC